LLDKAEAKSDKGATSRGRRIEGNLGVSVSSCQWLAMFDAVGGQIIESEMATMLTRLRHDSLCNLAFCKEPRSLSGKGFECVCEFRYAVDVAACEKAAARRKI